MERENLADADSTGRITVELACDVFLFTG